jgi:hypothetical protein
MEANCHNRARMAKYDKNTHGLRWQVPWGKHSPLSYRVLHIHGLHPKPVGHSHGELLRVEKKKTKEF